MLSREVPLGETNRSQAAYAYPTVVGSAVTDSLSLNAYDTSRLPEPRMIGHGSLQCRPPSVERLASTALAVSIALNDRLTWAAVPRPPTGTPGPAARA